MTYTDYLGKPINEGDTIIYPDDRGTFKTAKVHKLVDLVEHPGTSQYDKGKLARVDQLGHKDPTRFMMREPDKRYVIQIMRPKWRYSRGGSGEVPQRYSLPTIHAIVVDPKDVPA